MSITYQSIVKDDTLIITTSGRDENVQQAVDYGLSVIRLAVESGVKHVLCDERELEYALGTFDTYKLAEQLVANTPASVTRVAVVCKQEFLDDGKFWETVATNRGLKVRIDTDIERTKAWIKEGTV